MKSYDISRLVFHTATVGWAEQQLSPSDEACRLLNVAAFLPTPLLPSTQPASLSAVIPPHPEFI